MSDLVARGRGCMGAGAGATIGVSCGSVAVPRIGSVGRATGARAGEVAAHKYS